MSKRPTHRAVRLLERFCPPELFEGIAGDLEEQFEEDVFTMGEKHAKRRLLGNALKFFRPGILLRNNFRLRLTQTIMIGSYAKIASRNIMKRKMYSFINAFGLSIGMAFCVLIYLFILDERSFDQFHVNKNRIYRLEGKNYDLHDEQPEMYEENAWLQLGLQQVLKDEFPEVEKATRFNPNTDCVLRYKSKVFTEQVAFVDNDFFSMFSFPLLAGRAETLLKNKNEVVLTPPVVKKYFGDEDPLGKIVTLDIGGEKDLIVTGVIESPPANSSLDFQILVSTELRQGYERHVTQWGSFNSPLFFQLYPSASEAALKAKLDKLVERRMKNMIERWKDQSRKPVPDDVKVFEYVFTKLTDIHLKTRVGWTRVSDVKYSWILGGIAVLILLIACINYISLALTTSASRRTEVGVRKVVGAQKSQLMYQFGFESILLSLISMVVGIVLVILFLPSFNAFTGKSITLSVGLIPDVLPYSLAIAIFVGVVAGSYPSLFLSGFKPAIVLKGRFTSKLQAGFTRPLVILQFALSAFLIISSMIMYRQMRFIATKDLGFSQEQVIVIPTQSGWNAESDKTVARFRNKLQQQKRVISVAGVSSSFARGINIYGYKVGEEHKSAFVYCVDPYYIPLLDLKLIQGRNFDERIAADSTAIIVNEALVKDMGWKDPLNQYLNWKEDSTGLGYKVIGVVKDYHFRPLSEEISPMFLSIDSKAVGYLENMMVKVTPEDLPGSVEMLRRVWSEVSPAMPFDFAFLDQDVANQYESYDRWMRIMGFSTGFAILISCLGLFGLSGVNAINRTKEIGIRKVMGADVVNIFVLLNKQYTLLAFVSFLIAGPASWYVMNKWLADFKFSVDIGWDLFAMGLLAGLIISILTVSYHAIRTALLNPADTLKHE